MGISIQHDEVEAMIRRLADHRGSSLTDAIATAVRHELEREGVELAGQLPFSERLRLVQQMIASAPILDGRTPDEIIGYDDNGLPV